MDKTKTILEILILLNTLFIIISNYTKDYKIINWLLTKEIHLNILYVFLIIFIIILAFLYNPKYITKIAYKYRAKRLYKNWINFKNILIKYKESKDNSLQKNFGKITDQLKSDYYFLKKEIYETQRSFDREYINNILDGFELCFSVRKINERQNKVRRTIPEELDCFDYLILEVKEHYNK